ncbi:hypothetical protein LC55x_5659 [Lysobacter capsici]|nr:hypothetical protein LC55x_5659 [Lysobacter capsici]
MLRIATRASTGSRAHAAIGHTATERRAGAARAAPGPSPRAAHSRANRRCAATRKHEYPVFQGFFSPATNPRATARMRLNLHSQGIFRPRCARGPARN